MDFLVVVSFILGAVVGLITSLVIMIMIGKI
jgi:hypothetical protein